MRNVLQDIMLSAFIGILVSSCSTTDDISASDGDQEFQGTTYITVQVSVFDDDDTNTRAIPDGPGTDGGSDGEGNELGYENEYKVDNLTLLLFYNSDGETNIGNSNDDKNVILKSYYFKNLHQSGSNSKNIYYESLEKYELDPTLSKKNLNYIIIANAGDVGNNYVGKNVVQVADELLKNQWYATDAAGIPGAPVTTNASDGTPDCNKFLMTTDNQIYSFTSSNNTGTGDENDPKILFGKIKRLAARIDFMVNATNATKLNNEFKSVTIGGYTYSGYLYDAVDVNDNSEGKFLLTNVLPFNCQKEGTYFLKHIFSPDWQLNAVDGISHLTEYAKLEQEVWTTDTYNGATTRFKYSTNWVLDPWSTYETTDGTYTNKKGETKSCKIVNSQSIKNNHSSSLYTNYLAKSTTTSAELIANNWDFGWNQYMTREVENYVNDDKGKCYIVTYMNENTVIYKNAYDFATGVVFRGLYFTNEEWNNGSPKVKGMDMAYKYYLRHSDPYDVFNETGNPSEEAINKMTIDKTKITDKDGNKITTYDGITDLKNTMLYGTVRNNIYRVSINKVIAPEKPKEEPKLQIVLKVKPWTRYEHDEINM